MLAWFCHWRPSHRHQLLWCLWWRWRRWQPRPNFGRTAFGWRQWQSSILTEWIVCSWPWFGWSRYNANLTLASSSRKPEALDLFLTKLNTNYKYNICFSWNSCRRWNHGFCHWISCTGNYCFFFFWKFNLGLFFFC